MTPHVVGVIGTDVLMRCPCCGSMAKDVRARDYVKVRCVACGLNTPFMGPQWDGDGRTRAHKLWNRRT